MTTKRASEKSTAAVRKKRVKAEGGKSAGVKKKVAPVEAVQVPKIVAQPKTNESEWIELFPHGISVAPELGRPVLILKDQAGVEVLPVWMQPLDAGVALAELSHGSGASPHAVTKRLMELMGLAVETCVISELIGHHQYLEISFRGGPDVVKSLRVRADEAMSFCLQSRARIYSTKDFMVRCRDLDAQLTGLQVAQEIDSKKHPYMM